ncbi:hypothetical protein PTTG_25609 [Puccinia triticina 1-1 BBBD Race 1]|uniref:Uncharacterized protein n=1 Tax=Puccinia triticina (isolate 1-1 / race 1 (BBBD)) TaxID=630390 RepID=A0A180H233_PUCT1|nr:hypothetical protein PTTG_25609 [Puccinia triticina 1-1 BBBD Race 1]
MSNDTKGELPTHTSINLTPLTSASTPKILAARLPILKAPGSNSNYLNWKKVVLWVFKSAKVNHVLTSVADSSTGGRVYWIRKLVNAQMEGDDIHSHIESLAKSYERLNALVSPEKPLMPDDVHNAALLSSIPADWLHCVSALMNQEGVKTETIVSALKNEATCRESQGDIISVSSTSPALPSQTRQQTPLEVLASNHPRNLDLNSCNNTRKLIAEHKAAQKARWEASQQEKTPSSTRPTARAGRTLAATLGQSSHKYDEDDDQSDYSGSEIDVVAGNAVASLSASMNPFASGDVPAALSSSYHFTGQSSFLISRSAITISRSAMSTDKNCPIRGAHN